MTQAAASEDEQLVREALDGLFDIACEEHPAAVRDSLQQQIREMPVAECRTLVEQMVDTDQLASLVAERAQGAPERPPSAPEPRSEKVDEVLEPLVEWTCGEQGTRALQGMEEDERLNLLFSSLGPR